MFTQYFACCLDPILVGTIPAEDVDPYFQDDLKGLIKSLG